MSDRQTQSAPKAVDDCHALLAWIIPHLDGFPRARRFTLGSRIEAGLLFVLERLIEAAYSRQREDILHAANLRLDVIRHLWRLSHTLKAISTQEYGRGNEQMAELGRQIGGWRRASASA